MHQIPILSGFKSTLFTKSLNNIRKKLKMSWVRVPLSAPNTMYELV